MDDGTDGVPFKVGKDDLPKPAGGSDMDPVATTAVLPLFLNKLA